MMLDRKKWHEFMRFCIVGVIATGIHYGMYAMLHVWMNVNVAYTIAFLVSLGCNILLTSYFTFQKKLTWIRGGGFVLCHSINYGMHIGLFNLFLYLGFGEFASPLMVYCIVIPLNFLLVRFVFHRL